MPNVIGKIVRVSVHDRGTDSHYQSHLQFLQLNEDERSAIAKFVAEKMRSPELG